MRKKYVMLLFGCFLSSSSMALVWRGKWGLVSPHRLTRRCCEQEMLHTRESFSPWWLIFGLDRELRWVCFRESVTRKPMKLAGLNLLVLGGYPYAKKEPPRGFVTDMRRARERGSSCWSHAPAHVVVSFAVTSIFAPNPIGYITWERESGHGLHTHTHKHLRTKSWVIRDLGSISGGITTECQNGAFRGRNHLWANPPRLSVGSHYLSPSHVERQSHSSIYYNAPVHAHPFPSLSSTRRRRQHQQQSHPMVVGCCNRDATLSIPRQHPPTPQPKVETIRIAESNPQP